MPDILLPHPAFLEAFHNRSIRAACVRVADINLLLYLKGNSASIALSGHIGCALDDFYKREIPGYRENFWK